LNKIQRASRQSPPELGQQSIIRAVGITYDGLCFLKREFGRS
jgi:hypothetical protein